MEMRREAEQAPQTSRKAAGHRDGAIFARTLSESGATMAHVIVAGGLSGYTLADLFPAGVSA